MPTPNEKIVSVLTVDEAKKKLELVKANVMKHAGKKGVNPFLWIKNNLNPLEKNIQENLRAIADLPDNPELPVLVKHPTPEPAKK